MSKEQLNADEIRIQGLIDGLLRQSKGGSTAPADGHIDEDTLTAFVEGNLLEREAGPVVSHLSDCGFCRNVTAELVRLDMVMSESETVEAAIEKEPSRISAILHNLFGGLFGEEHDAVFAHEEKKDEEEEDESK